MAPLSEASEPKQSSDFPGHEISCLRLTERE